MAPLIGKTIHFTGQKRSALDMARGRLVFLGVVFALFYIIVAARLVDLSLIQGELQKNEETVSFLERKPDELKTVLRADILDRNGVILARSLNTASLYADPAVIENPKEVAEGLIKIFPDLQYGDLLKKLQGNKRFVWIKRNITPTDQYKILYLGQPGLSFKSEERRFYPQGSLFSHIIGYTDVDSHGLAGLEGGFDTLLMKEDQALVTTLDVRLQHVVRRELASAIQKFQAKAGAGIIMDVRTGEILSAVSLPDFDPYQIDSKDKDSLFNRVSLGVFEPGSTFKIFTSAAALELAQAKMDTTYDARFPIHVGRFRISDYHAEKRILTFPEVFMHSSNIGSVKMAQSVGTEEFKEFLDDIGILKAPSLEISEVGSPLVPHPWRDINTMTVAFGHGIAVSPLQLVSAAASIVNGGYTIRPTFVKQQGIQREKNLSGKRVVSERTSLMMRQLMRLVVTDGTGKKADVPGLNVAGKTGTAEKNEGRGYEKNKLISSFLGFFPAEEPQYAVFIMVDEPHGNKESYGYATAGWVAAPAVGQVIESIAAIEGLRPIEEDKMAGVLNDYIPDLADKGEKVASFTDH